MTFQFKVFGDAFAHQAYQSPAELEHAGYLAEVTQTDVSEPRYDWTLFYPVGNGLI